MEINNSKTLRLILADQLNIKHSWFEKVDNSVSYVLMEVRSETDYVCHHIQKVIGFFAAMRHFKIKLESLGHKVHYYHLTDEKNSQDFAQNLKTLIVQHNFTKFEYQLPDEYRLDQYFKVNVPNLSIDYSTYDSEHFYTSRDELEGLFKGKKSFLMETFYRYMRKKHLVLVDESLNPLFGKWNFDQENRKKLPKSHKPISPMIFNNDLSEIELDLEKTGLKTIGFVDSKHFLWPITREESLQLLDFFVEQCLPYFGTFQDAMTPDEWSIYHSRLSFSLNIKLISPKEVVDKVINFYEVNSKSIEFNQVEGFVRQIIGWREYMRGIYWSKMPKYAELNYFENSNSLPSWYWNGKTKMNCLKQCIQQSLNFSYAHHIQRLMVTGNFALLAGVDPNEVDLWYLGIYIDAIEWVEITNTRGMSQFADGGIVATKPYVSSASYINKMSSYCSNCYYDKAKKTGEKSCPFNSLYWNFYEINREKLKGNMRISMMYSVWDKMEIETRNDILKQANFYLENINTL